MKKIFEKVKFQVEDQYKEMAAKIKENQKKPEIKVEKKD